MNFLTRLEWRLSRAFGKPTGNLIFQILRNLGIFLALSAVELLVMNLDSEKLLIVIATNSALGLVTAIIANRAVYSKFVGVEKINLLTTDQKVIYMAGLGDTYILAEATVIKSPGYTSCMIRIDRIIRRGDNADERVGEERVASGDELFFG